MLLLCLSVMGRFNDIGVMDSRDECLMVCNCMMDRGVISSDGFEVLRNLMVLLNFMVLVFEVLSNFMVLFNFFMRMLLLIVLVMVLLVEV